MRYIRTKNKIYDTCSSEITLSKNKTTHELEFFYQSYAFSIPFKLEVLNQADTIEELVDEYVCVMPSGETFLLNKNTDLKAQVNYIGDVYGEIWVDGELHKVAKMNEKGELALL